MPPESSTKVNPKEKALREMEEHIAIAKADTRKRKKWSVIQTESLLEWAKEHGGDETLTIEALAIKWAREQHEHIPDGVPVRIKPADEIDKNELIAVWNDKEEEPDCEPFGF